MRDRLLRPSALIPTLLALTVLLPGVGPARADDAQWELIKGGGQVVMLRHTTAPGTYDPPGFRLDDCASQRNLSDAGRAEARRIGDAFRARGVAVGRVLSSRWCRCLETARLAFGRVEPWPLLDSLRRGEEDARTSETRAFVSRRFTGPSTVLVTHQFNIRAVTGLPSIDSGEMIVLTPLGDAGFRVAGRIALPR